MIKMKYIPLLTTVLIFVCFCSCKKRGCTDPTATNYNSEAEVDDGNCSYDNLSQELPIIQLNTTHLFNSTSFSYDSIYQDDFGNNIKFSRAQFYFGNPKFKNSADSNADSSRNYILINPSKSAYTFDTILPGNYNKLDVLIGVDNFTNHLDPAIYPSSNDLSYQSPSMHWQMGSSPQNWSYLFIVLEGVVDIDGNNSFDPGESFVFHIGDDENSCKLSNLSVNIEASYNDILNLNLNVNWAGFISGIDLSVDNFAHSGTITSAISSNGSNVISFQ